MSRLIKTVMNSLLLLMYNFARTVCAPFRWNKTTNYFQFTNTTYQQQYQNLCRLSNRFIQYKQLQLLPTISLSLYTKRTEYFINTMFYKIPLKCFYFLWCERLIFYIIFILLFFIQKYERIANLVYFAYIFYMKIEMAALGARNCILDNISINNGTHK